MKIHLENVIIVTEIIQNSNYIDVQDAKCKFIVAGIVKSCAGIFTNITANKYLFTSSF